MISFIDKFAKDYFLVGETGIALQIGHRFSIDFDLFTSESESLKRRQIDRELRKSSYNFAVLIDTDYHYEVLINGVRITWYAYPYQLQGGLESLENLRIPHLVTLGAMKAHAVQRRAKRKDYVDLAMLIPMLGYEDIIDTAGYMFGGAFSEKLFLAQLAYFDDIDYKEEVEWCEGHQTSKDSIKKKLLEIVELHSRVAFLLVIFLFITIVISNKSSPGTEELFSYMYSPNLRAVF